MRDLNPPLNGELNEAESMHVHVYMGSNNGVGRFTEKHWFSELIFAHTSTYVFRFISQKKFVSENLFAAWRHK